MWHVTCAQVAAAELETGQLSERVTVLTFAEERAKDLESELATLKEQQEETAAQLQAARKEKTALQVRVVICSAGHDVCLVSNRGNWCQLAVGGAARCWMRVRPSRPMTTAPRLLRQIAGPYC